MAGIATEENTTMGPGPWLPSSGVASSTSVFVDGKKCLLHEDIITPHDKPGKKPSTRSGAVIASSKVFIEGKQVAQIGDIASGGQVITSGNPSVFAS